MCCLQAVSDRSMNSIGTFKRNDMKQTMFT